MQPKPTSIVNFDLNAFWDQQFAEHTAVVEKTHEQLFDDFYRLLEACTKAIQNGNKILFCGNGGSAADAQHLATELTARYVKDRAAIAALALTTDTSALTAIGNDMGYDRVFARQVEALGQAGDVLIGISTSGTSPNVLAALEEARRLELVTIGLTGESGGKLADHCDVVLRVPSRVTARIQEMHITLGQMLCGALEQELGLV